MGRAKPWWRSLRLIDSSPRLANRGIIIERGAATRASASKRSRVLDRLDAGLDRVIQHQIIEHCKLLEGAFEELGKHSIPPSKASAEFGLQVNGEGNVFVAKVAGQASFKIAFEWSLR